MRVNLSVHRLFQIIILLITSTSVYAANVTYTNPDKINIIAAYGVGNIGIHTLSTVMTNPAGCPATETNKWYKIVDSTDQGKNMLSLALTAKTAGNDAQLLIDNVTCSSGGYAVIDMIIIR